ncbi:MAG: DNA alkylation repair protein [Verrucomicrobia bacterium]|nr:DNA alkylation repair protein [Verrucomicrobiota bacterium]
MIEDIQKLFASAANPEIALKQAAYMRNLFPFLGIPKPERERLEKEIFKKTAINDLPGLLLRLWEQDHREYQYTALCLAQRHRKMLTPEIVPTLEKLIRTKSWWDTVDTIAPNLVGPLVKIHPKLLPLMDQWIEDPYLWIRRSALLFQLRWKKETDEERLFYYCQKTLHEKDFFIRKAIGWSLREYSKTKPASVRCFITHHRSRLSNLSLREACKYLDNF